MSASRAPMRWRFFAAGASAILTAVVAGGLLDRALVLAEAPPQLRFGVSAAAMLVLLVGPLMYSLERWVIRPLVALDHLHDNKPHEDRKALRTADLPKEMAEVISHHTDMLGALHSTNERLRDEVERRTAALEVIISAADVLSRVRPGASVARELLPELARLNAGCAAAMVSRVENCWVATILPPGRLDPDAVPSLEKRVQKALGRGERVRVEWLPPADETGPLVDHLRLLVRESVTEDSRSPAALALLSVRSTGQAPAAGDLHRVLSTIGAWVARVSPHLVLKKAG